MYRTFREKLVEINANQLIFVPVGFKFAMGRKLTWCFWDGSKEQVGACCVWDKPILVDPDEYKSAVVDKVKEMLPHLTSITKYKARNGNTIVTAFASDETTKPSVIINADPQPWIENYEIELQSGGA